jgi:hypothetical protein
VQSSDRLTVLIFCDGDGEIVGTPYDSGINRAFQQQQADRKKARQPFIIVLRSQLGRYVGCTMDWPAGLVSLPAFPPLPPPPPNEPAGAPPPPPPPVVTAPPLIVIGTKVGTNLLPPAPAPVPRPTTNPPPPAIVMLPTNIIANVETNAPVTAPTNFVAPPAGVQTNAIAPPAGSGLSGKKALVTGAAALVLAGVLAVFMIGRSHRATHGSLITRSMDRGAKPPPRT